MTTTGYGTISINRAAVVAEDVLFNLLPGFHNAVNVRIDLQAEDGGKFQMVVINGGIVIGRFDNGIAVLPGEAFQRVQIRELLLAHGFKVDVELPVFLHEIDAVRTVATDAREVKLRASCLHVPQHFGELVHCDACGAWYRKNGAPVLLRLLTRVPAP